ncbi:predicted protein [Uncinocarpus reesii 1704]|uniref:Uncharacterized protein n=1 Tax=Uncinocarpus reesii (strain UAMH 1704) TaxID=336963 RepID=C4JJH7_UNCRE|nr:uncharacterized protein UREG_01784 [Uncinocarpus reesii 1704]EEP76935.1 predicted protein [Uncinocarpus reesii 1704]
MANGKMECKRGTKIDKILARVNWIDDLDSVTVAKLRGTLAGRFSIEKLPVAMWDWQEWSKKHPKIGGIEYDAQSSRIQIKAMPSPLQEDLSISIHDCLIDYESKEHLIKL